MGRGRRFASGRRGKASKFFGPTTSPLAEACRYALLGGGKRFRPAMVFLMNDALGSHADVTQAALAVEMFHTASLIADDLPCMDDDDMRRSRPSLHRVYGEAVALLASYALIAEGYHCLARVGAKGEIASEVLLLALENVAQNCGVLGAAGGQYLDLYPPNLHLDTVLEVLKKKTVTLFEMAFVLGWLYGQGDPKALPAVKRAAFHFGMAFQIADDLDDMKQDKKKVGAVSLALLLGPEPTKQRFLEEAASFRKEMQELGLERSELVQMIEILTQIGV